MERLNFIDMSEEELSERLSFDYDNEIEFDLDNTSILEVINNESEKEN